MKERRESDAPLGLDGGDYERRVAKARKVRGRWLAVTNAPATLPVTAALFQCSSSRDYGRDHHPKPKGEELNNVDTAITPTSRAAFGGAKWSQKWVSCEGDDFSYYKSVLKSKKPAKTFRISHCTLHGIKTGPSSSRPDNTFEVHRQATCPLGSGFADALPCLTNHPRPISPPMSRPIYRSSECVRAHVQTIRQSSHAGLTMSTRCGTIICRCTPRMGRVRRRREMERSRHQKRKG